MRRDSLDLPIETLIAFVDRNAPWIDAINYGTGENTLSDVWFSLVKYVRSKYPAIRQALTTNGYLSQALMQRRDGNEILTALDEVDVSVDYHEPAKHATFRGHPDAFQWATQTIALCRNHDIPTTIVVLGIDSTLERKAIEGIFCLAEETECFVRINIFRPNIGQNLPPLSYYRLKDTLLHLIEHKHLVALSDPLIAALVLGTPCNDFSGQGSLRILPDGSITPSTYLVSDPWRRASVVDARLGSQEFQQSLGENIVGIVSPDDCAGCPVVKLCRGGAIDRRVIWYGGLSRRDPYCPCRHRDCVGNWLREADVASMAGPEIHNGYLPTVIFSSVRR